MTRKKKTAIVAVVFMVLIVAVLLIVATSTESKGTIKKSSPETVKKVRGSQALEGKAFKTKHPGNYSPSNKVPKDSGSTEQHVLLASLPNVRQAAVTVRPLVAGGLKEDGNYNMRAAYPQTYRESNRVIGTQKVTIMTKEGGVEVVGFIINRGRLATIALTKSDQEGKLEDDLAGFIQAWEWKP